MTSKKSNNLNEKSELKTFIANLRSGNLIQLIETNQMQFEEKCNYVNEKLNQSEVEIQNKILILEQNSHLIEKFQNKLQGLSDENIKLQQQQQALKYENEYLRAELQHSEDRFAQLDVLYDQKLSDLVEKNEELKQHVKDMESSAKMTIGQFDLVQTDLKEIKAKAEERVVELQNQLSQCNLEKRREKEEFSEKLNNSNDLLRQKTVDYEEQIKDLQAKLAEALDANREIHDLKYQMKQIDNERTEDRDKFNNEKERLVSLNDDLLEKIEDFKKRLTNKDKAIDDVRNKLFAKEKETEELYLKVKQITRNAKSITANTSNSSLNEKLSNRKLQKSSDDDPKPIDSSSESDASSISIYKFRKRRMVSNDLDDNKPNNGPHQFRAPSFGFKNNRNQNHLEDIEIPESPVVSSSAFGK